MRKKAFIACGIIGTFVLIGILFTVLNASIGIIGGSDGPAKVIVS